MRPSAVAMLFLLFSSGCASTQAGADSSVATADEFWVMRATTSNSCRVQKSTEAPIGARYKGPFDTRENARRAMCAALDSSMTDHTKCWVVVPDGACN